MKKVYINLIWTGALMLLFIGFTVLVGYTLLNSSEIVPFGTIGLFPMNKWFKDLVGFNKTLCDVTNVMTYAYLIVPVIFGGIAIYQWIKRKSLKEVDWQLYAFIFVSIIMIIFYVLFEFLIVNYRPVLIDGKPEASYPSSTMLMTTTLGGMAIMEIKRLVANKNLRITLQSILAVVSLVLMVGRSISGAHWLSDLIGGLILGSSLVMLYVTLISWIDVKKGKVSETKE